VSRLEALSHRRGASRSSESGDGSFSLATLKTMQSTWLRRLALMAVVVIGAAFRLYRLDAFAIWRDEAQTIFLARHTFPAGILRSLLSADVSPPLYYFLLHFWDKAFGSDWGLRFSSVAVGLVTIPSVYWVGRRLFNTRVALLAALAAALSPHHIVVSRTVRMYTLLPLVSLLALYAVYRFMTLAVTETARTRRMVWLAVVLSFALVLYTHNVGAFLVLSLNCFVAVEMLWRKEVRRLFWPWAISQAAAALLFVPWLPALFQQLRSQGAVMGPWLARQSRLGNALRLFNELTGLTWPAGTPWLWMTVCALGTVTIRFRHTLLAFYLRFSTELNLVLCGFAGPILLAALLTPRSIGVIPSYVTLVAFPAMCFLLARGVDAVRHRALGLLLLLALTVVWVRTVSVTYVRRTSNLREVAAYVTQHAGQQDVIVVAPDYLASTVNYYYQGKQPQVAFPSTLGRVEDITWVGWAEHWVHADQAIEPTLQYVADNVVPGAHVWLIAPLAGYPNDPYFSQIRVLKSRLDQAYGAPHVVDSFPPAVEYAEVYIYQ